MQSIDALALVLPSQAQENAFKLQFDANVYKVNMSEHLVIHKSPTAWLSFPPPIFSESGESLSSNQDSHDILSLCLDHH